MSAHAGTGGAWAVPATVADDGDVVTVARAWPGRDGGVVVEGRDQHGRLRAGTLARDGRAVLLPYGTDPRLPALAGLVGADDPGTGGRLVVHRAGRRAVVHHDGGYTKVVRPGRAARVAEASRAGQGLATGAGLAAPSVLRADDDTVTSSVLPGRPVHELPDDPAWGRVWTTWAEAWTRLQTGEGAGLAPHTDADEAQVVRGWAARAGDADVLPQVWLERAELAARALEQLPPPARLVPSHRDLHDKQLLWDGSALGVLDLDTACLAAPELDPVNLAVHADLRHAQGLWTSGAADVVARTARGVAEPAAPDRGRLRTAELATVARLACVYAFRPAWREVVLGWADERWAEPGIAG